MSNGSGDGCGKLFSRLRLVDIPPGVVRDPGERPEEPCPSASLTRISIAFPISPLTFFNTARLCLSSLNPISCSPATLSSRSAAFGWPTSAPNNCEGLFLLGGEGERSRESGRAAAAAASRRAFDDNGKIDDADLKPNLLPVLGGKGGG
jgi:hypothetical protein